MEGADDAHATGTVTGHGGSQADSWIHREPRISVIIPALNEARNLPHVFAELPASTTLANGSGSFTVVFKAPGPQTITAVDAANPAFVGISLPIDVTRATHAPGTPFVRALSGYGGIQLEWNPPKDNGYPIMSMYRFSE